MKRSRTILWVLVGIAVAALFVTTGARRLRRETVESIDQIQARLGIPVDVVTARVVPVEDWREFTGIAQGTEQVDLVSDYRSRVTHVHARVGDEVRRGTVIVSFDAFDPVRFATNYQTLKTAYETARRDSLRMEELYKTGAVSVQDLDRVRSATEAARSAYLMSARAVHLDTPIDGIVTATYVNPGDYADGGQVVATVAAFDRIRVTLTVSAAERSSIEPGQVARLRLRRGDVRGRSCTTGMQNDSTAAAEGEEIVLNGRVTKAALSADASSRLFTVEVVLDNPEHVVKPGMMVSPEILVASSNDLPAVPPVALFQRNGSEYAYVVISRGDSLTATLRTVKPAVRNGRLVAVAAGLGVGEQVVVAGQHRLESGVRVALHRDLTDDYFSLIPLRG